MYKNVYLGYKIFLYHKNVIIYNKNNYKWLYIKNTEFAIIKDGVLFENKITFWNDLNKIYIDKISFKISNSKKENKLKSFLLYLYDSYNNKEEYMSKKLEQCHNDIATISEKLDFFEEVFKNLEKIRVSI